MTGKGAVFKYEFFSALRSRWLILFALLLAASASGFVHLVDDPRKAELALVNIVCVIVPLISVLFATAYWYNMELFTELLLSQPVSRRRLFWSRMSAISAALIVANIAGTLIPCAVLGVRDSGLLWLAGAIIFLAVTFCTIGGALATFVADKMWGIGLALAVWCYFELVHDGILLLILVAYRDYPLDLFTAVGSALNPVSLTRVVLLMKFDAPLLLGHAGALIRRLVEENTGLVYSSFFAMLWLAVPSIIASRRFSKRDF